jgi:hypothetical protein
MASLSSHGNIYNTCLRILRKKGFEVWIEKWIEGKNTSKDPLEADTLVWKAKKEDYDFAAFNPVELLGLISIYEYKRPIEPPTSYWWSEEGDDVYKELLRNMIIINVDEEDDDDDDDDDE